MGKFPEANLWRTIFFNLNNNQIDRDVLPMWEQFKGGNLEVGDIKEVFMQHNFTDKVKVKFKEMEARNTKSRDLLEEMKREPIFGEEEWERLVVCLRDRESKPLNKDESVLIIEGGHSKFLTMKDLEDKFANENPDYQHTQTSIPENLVHDDNFEAHLNRQTIIKVIQKQYEHDCQRIKEELQKESPKRKHEEVCKQAEKQALEVMRKSKDFQYLQQRDSLYAEYIVQKSVLEAAKEQNIPVVIFRGVNTYEDIGQFLKSLGILTSKLKSFQPTERATTYECEHDIAIFALTSSGPVASFVQVN